MLVVAEGDRIVGGALAFRRTQGDVGATLRVLGLEPGDDLPAGRVCRVG